MTVEGMQEKGHGHPHPSLDRAPNTTPPLNSQGLPIHCHPSKSNHSTNIYQSLSVRQALCQVPAVSETVPRILVWIQVQWSQQIRRWLLLQRQFPTLISQIDSLVKREKAENPCNDMDEPRRIMMSTRSQMQKQIAYINACVWSLERSYWWTYLQSSNGGWRLGEQTFMDTWGWWIGRRGGGKWRESHGNIH